MNIAIILGVSEYLSLQNLEGCKTDATQIYNIIGKTSKFDDILYINEPTSSAKIKEDITDFISKHKDDLIEELFFYFTGHGQFFNEEFYYALPEFESKKRNQTTLQNKEIDYLFKSLSPGLVVKVIDACESGTPYVKNIEDTGEGIKALFEETRGTFKKCYFLSSSSNSQSSFQSKEISDFTFSFINAIKTHESTTIRYKSIIDSISDSFAESHLQTPFFVIQADMTEKFCEINDALKLYLEQDAKFATEEHETEDNLSLLVENVKKQAKDYLAKEEVISLIEKMKTTIKRIKHDIELEEIFEYDIEFKEDYSDLAKEDSVGKWLDENPHEYFARSAFKRVRKDRFTNPLGSVARLYGSVGKPEDYESIRNGFVFDVDVPYKTVIISLEPKFPNLDSYTARIIFFVSKRKMRFFYFFAELETINWDENVLSKDFKWSTLEVQLKDSESVSAAVQDIFTAFEKFVKAQVEEKVSRDVDD